MPMKKSTRKIRHTFTLSRESYNFIKKTNSQTETEVSLGVPGSVDSGKGARATTR
jgi:hypothetical protein